MTRASQSDSNMLRILTKFMGHERQKTVSIMIETAFWSYANIYIDIRLL